MKLMRPKQINILGKTYKVEYCNSQNDVDIHGGESLWGQIDSRSKVIRIFDCGRETGDVFETLIHEVLHGIVDELNIDIFESDAGHAHLGTIAVALADVLTRNNFIKNPDNVEIEAYNAE